MNKFEPSHSSIVPAHPFNDSRAPQIKDHSSWYEIYVLPIVGPIFRRLGILSGYESQLMHAIIKDDANEVRKLCKRGTDFNTSLFHMHGYTPLMFAVKCGSINSLKELIQLGVDVNKRSNSRDKIMALYLASISDHLKNKQINILRVLLQNGANPNLAIKGGSTPIMEASYQGNEEVLEELIKYKIDFNLIDSGKNTALDLAVDCLGLENGTVQKMVALGAKRFNELEDQFVILSSNQLKTQQHPKINSEDIFKSGYLLPKQTLNAVLEYKGKESKIKKYDERFPSLFRSVLRGKGDYILYDSHSFFNTCEGCLKGVSPNNYLGKGGEAKVKIAQVIQTGDYVAVRISKQIGTHELEILKKMGLLIDYIHVGTKHYIIQRLLMGDRLSRYLYSSFKKKNSQEQYLTIKDLMIQLLKQLDHLHKDGYLHRDLASDNVMIDPKTGETTIIDFGMAVREPNYLNGYVRDRVMKVGGEIAPELYNLSILYGVPYSQQSDIYALGTILAELLSLSNNQEAHSIGQPLCQQMMSELPHKRQDAAYYLDIFTNW